MGIIHPYCSTKYGIIAHGKMNLKTKPKQNVCNCFVSASMVVVQSSEHS